MTGDLPGWEARLLAAAQAEDTAAVLASCDWPRRYQARAALPRGTRAARGERIVYCGIGGVNRDMARADLAALFRTDAKHWTVTKIPHPDRRG